RAASFPMLYAEILKSGVRNNQLGATLCNLTAHLSLASAGRRLLWESVAYPLIVLVLGTALLTFFMLVVVPQFADVARSLEDQEVWNWSTGTMETHTLPLMTQAMFALSQNWIRIIVIFAATLASLLAAWWALRIIPGGAAARESIILHVPAFGRIYRASL